MVRCVGQVCLSVRQRASRGQGTLEFALVSLLLMTLFFGVLDLGRGVFQRQDLANAAREGARFASLTLTTSTMTTDAFATEVARAANARSPSLGLTATNFKASGNGAITCQYWNSTTGQWQTLPCVATTSAETAQPGDRLTVCVGYTFRPIATRLLGLGAIPMNDCTSIAIQ